MIDLVATTAQVRRETRITHACLINLIHQAHSLQQNPVSSYEARISRLMMMTCDRAEEAGVLMLAAIAIDRLAQLVEVQP